MERDIFFNFLNLSKPIFAMYWTDLSYFCIFIKIRRFLQMNNMQHILVHSKPIKNLISDLAKAFNTEFIIDCDEYTLQLPDHIGSGTIKGINFQGGLGIVQYEVSFFEDTEIQFVLDEVHPLKFMFSVANTLEHHFKEDKKNIYLIHQYQNAIVASSYHNSHVLTFKKNKKVNIKSLEIDRKVFNIRMDCDLKKLGGRLEQLFRDTEAQEDFFYDGYYSLHIADLFLEIAKSPHTDFINKLFLEGKAYQILTEQISQYEDEVKDTAQQILMQKFTIPQIKKIVKKIDSKLSDLDTIAIMAKEVGVNEKNLQAGFKILFHVTINHYIQKIRLEKIRDLLISTDMNMSEIAFEVGIKSKSYLSKIFKEHYGISPTEFKQAVLEDARSKHSD